MTMTMSGFLGYIYYLVMIFRLWQRVWDNIRQFVIGFHRI